MVLSACAESFIRFLFMGTHWGWTLTFLVGAALISQFAHQLKAFFGIVTGALDAVMDSAWLLGDIGAPAIGLMWVVNVWGSEAFFPLKILATPLAFVLGTIIGILPDFGIGSALLGLALGFRTSANVTCVLLSLGPLALFIPGLEIFGSETCTLFSNYSSYFA